MYIGKLLADQSNSEKILKRKANKIYYKLNVADAKIIFNTAYCNYYYFYFYY